MTIAESVKVVGTDSFQSTNAFDSESLIGQSLVLLDSRLDDLNFLLGGLRPSSNGITVSEQTDLFSLLERPYPKLQHKQLHLVAHGAPGLVKIGSVSLTKESLALNHHRIAQWPWKQIFLWSCETGLDQDFIALLEELSGAEVISSQSFLGDGTSLVNSPKDDPFEPNYFSQYRHKLALEQYTVLDADPNTKTNWNFSGGSYTTDPDSNFSEPITFNATPGDYVIGFSTFTPESYTGGGDLYLDNIKITTNTGVTLLEEDFSVWTEVTPNPNSITDGSTVNPRQQFQSNTGVWNTFIGITPYQGGGFGDNTTLYPPFTLDSQGVRYPFDGDADLDSPNDDINEGYEVNIVSNVSVPSGASSFVVDFDYQYSVGYIPSSATNNQPTTESRLFVVAIDRVGTLPEDLFDFSPGGPATFGGDTSGSGDEDTTIIGTLTAADLDGLTDGTYFSIESGNEASNGIASIDAETGEWSYTPTDNFNGDDAFTVTVTDDAGGITSQVISITLNEVNDAPTGSATGIIADTEEDTDLIIPLSSLVAGFSDVDGDSLSVADLSVDSGSIVDNGDGRLSYSPEPDFNGLVNLVYTVTDGEGGEIAGVTRSFNVAPVNEAPPALPPAPPVAPPPVLPPSVELPPVLPPPVDLPETSEPLLTPFVEQKLLETTRLGRSNTVRLQLNQVGIGDVSEIRILSIEDLSGSNPTQIARFSVLEGDRLPSAYSPFLTLDSDRINSGRFLQFEIVENGVSRLATPTPVSDVKSLLDFGDGTVLDIEFSNETPTTNLMMNDAAAIDLNSQVGPVTVEMQVYRSAQYDSTVGFYRTDTMNGDIVTDALTGAVISPGEVGYKEAALARQLDTQLTGENDAVLNYTAQWESGGYLGVYLIADGTDPNTSDVYFSHGAANGNANDHVKQLGSNTFGFEDMADLGDRDYNDFVVQFSIV